MEAGSGTRGEIILNHKRKNEPKENAQGRGKQTGDAIQAENGMEHEKTILKKMPAIQRGGRG